MQLAPKLLLYGPCRSSSLSPACEPEVIFSKQTLVTSLPLPSPLVHACAHTHVHEHTHTHTQTPAGMKSLQHLVGAD